MADVINLRQARKTRARQEKADKAAANRRLFGQTKVEKEQATQTKSRSERWLDGHKILKLEGEDPST